MVLPIITLFGDDQEAVSLFINVHLLQQLSTDEFLKLLSQIGDEQKVHGGNKAQFLINFILKEKKSFVWLIKLYRSIIARNKNLTENLVQRAKAEILPKFHERIEVSCAKACQDGAKEVRRLVVTFIIERKIC